MPGEQINVCLLCALYYVTRTCYINVWKPHTPRSVGVLNYKCLFIASLNWTIYLEICHLNCILSKLKRAVCAELFMRIQKKYREYAIYYSYREHVTVFEQNNWLPYFLGWIASLFDFTKHRNEMFWKMLHSLINVTCFALVREQHKFKCQWYKLYG